jgi:hypothetical protein
MYEIVRDLIAFGRMDWKQLWIDFWPTNSSKIASFTDD